MPDLLQRLDRFPPCLCRVIARDGRGRPLTSHEIAERGGISRTQVDRISRLTTWATVPIGTADAYLSGCRINPFQMRRHVQFRKRLQDANNPRIAHARNTPYFKRLNRYVGAKAKAQKKAVG